MRAISHCPSCGGQLSVAEAVQDHAPRQMAGNTVRTSKGILKIPGATAEGRKGRHRKYPWLELEPGESFRVSYRFGNIPSVLTGISTAKSRYGRTFTAEKKRGFMEVRRVA